ncbi:MAG: sigma-70 family RNA polymerase sigma factor [Bacteroidales bacterium]|nr:sigma-70 family RNA polymerase sigma factor [Bacteroidales bacterium]
MAQTGSKHIDELVGRAISGDGTAFTALWDANISSVRSYLRKTMTQLDHFYIEDVCSKTFEKAFRQISSFNPELGSFEVWLVRIAHNTALDVIDQEKRRQRGYVSFDDDPRTLNAVDAMSGVEEDALDEIIKTEAREETESMVDGLPELYRDIARKRLIEGMQYKEIAEETGLELNTVRTRIRRAKQMLDKMKNLIIIVFAMLGLSLQTLAADYHYISVNTAGTSIVMVGKVGGPLNYRHYGPSVSNAADFTKYSAYADSHSVGDIPMYPTAGGKFVFEPALAVTYPDGGLNTELIYESWEQETLSPDLVRTKVNLRDSKQPLRVCLVFDAYWEEDVILMHSEITNDAKKSVVLRNFYSASIPLWAPKYTLTHFNGAWANENCIETERLTHGAKVIECRDGARATQRSNPSFLLSLDSDTLDETHGEVIAGALRWSGNYKINFQMDEAGRMYILSGIHPTGAEYTLAGGASFITPEAVFTYSTSGAGQASRNLHDWARRYGMYDASMHCPMLLNSWEGAYFAFDTKTLTDMIDDAASMGLEMFVLDDGWFGNGEFARDNDKAGLGDWELNVKKIPEGIGYLADYAHSKGLKFGIWIEPEMVNPKSNLYLKHPDWVVNEKGREAYPARNQLLLDLSNPKVQDFVFGVFDRTMQLGDIDYIKWDCNRHVYNVGSNYESNQSNFWVDYVKGYYSVLDRIRAKYPKVFLQSCSSGGGRMDYGVLNWANEVWASDNTDAHCRAFIQYGASLIYPAQILGSHISASPNHQTGRVIPLKFRCDMAASARLGMEIQPKQLTDEEKTYIKGYLTEYKQFRDIVFDGDLYRISSPYDGDHYALMYASKDKSKAVLFAFCLQYNGRGFVPKFRAGGLDPAARYKVSEIAPVRKSFWGDGMEFGGDYLMNFGLNLSLNKPYQSTVLLLERQ